MHWACTGRGFSPLHKVQSLRKCASVWGGGGGFSVAERSNASHMCCSLCPIIADGLCPRFPMYNRNTSIRLRLLLFFTWEFRNN